MAGIGSNYLDIIDVMKREDPDGSIATVIEMLMEMNPMMQDMYAVECNNGTQHRHTIRTGLPTVAWGKLYQGTPQSKSRTAQVDDTTGFVEGLSTIDERVLELAGGKAAALRLSEAKAFMESMAQEVQDTMIYGNSNSAPEEFMGLAPRFNDTSAENGQQIIDAGGTGSDNTSIWIVTWGDHCCHALYPEGTQAGVKREDMGRQRVLDASNNPYYVQEEKFTQHIGIAVKDWRYITRVANIDVSLMQADPTNIDGSNNSLYHYLRKAWYQNQGRRFPMGGQVRMYCNTDVLEALDALGTNAGTNDVFARLKPMELQGQEVLSYRGVPIRETDALTNAEAQVT